MHWAIKYIGIPWEAGAEGPDAFDCRTLFIDIQRKIYGRQVTPIMTDAEDTKAILKAFQNHPEFRQWQRVDTPKDGDAVLLRQSRYPCHIGVWLEADGGKILHSVQGAGVVFQSVHDLISNGWQVQAYYGFVGGNHE